MSTETFMVTDYLIINISSEPTRKSLVGVFGAGGITCSVWFLDEPAPLPAASKDAPNQFTFYYRHRQLEHFIDMLRNEKPIRVSFIPSSSFGIIYTGFEPIGEAEFIASALKALEP